MNKINLIQLSKNKEGRLFDREINGSLILTYNLDLVFYENWILRKFRELGSVNNLVLSDLTQLCLTHNLQHEYLRYDSSVYVAEGISLGNLFHPKIIYLSGDNEDKLFIGSGNLTIGGLSDNAELYAQFSSGNPDEKSVFVGFYKYINSLFEKSNVSQFFKSRTDGVLSKKGNMLNVTENVNGNYKFIHNIETPIITQVKELTKDIKHVYAISPFFDSNFEAAKYIKENICQNVAIYFQEEYTNINVENITDEFSFYKFPSGFISEGNLHTKLLIFEEENCINVLMGSPNLTKAALLTNADKGNVETAVYFKTLDKELLNYYLPKEKERINKEAIVPINFSSQISKEDLLIKSATLNNQGVLEIHLWKELSSEQKVEVFLDDKNVDKGSLRVDETLTRIDLLGIYEAENVLKVHLRIDGIKSNVTIVVNQQKSVTSLLRGETKVLNELKNILKVDSFERLLFARSFDPLVDIQKQESVEYLSLNKNYVKDEKEEVESDVEKSVSDFYISVKEISEDDTFLIKDSSSYLLDLLKIFKQQRKINGSDIGKGKTAKEKTEHFPEENRGSELSRFRKSLIHNFENNISFLSSFYQQSKKDGLSDKEAFTYIRNTSNTLPLFNLLLSGVEMEIPLQEPVAVSLTKAEIREYLYPLLKIIYTFWSSLLLHNDNLKKLLSRKYILNFYLLSVMNLLLIEDCINKDKSHEDIQINKQAYSYIFSSILILFIKVNDKFEFLDNELYKTWQEISDNFTQPISEKLLLTEKFESQSKLLINSIKETNVNDNEPVLFQKFNKALNNSGEFSLPEALNSVVNN
ncbi:MAG: hypothetical protein UT08_C0013G0018 [Candidatus Woesebacteria bacterium GW2011_GWB1_38_8]|uniref:PLD phosphodiesterase domain-containing protein n=1 Tax=Candidatus Woesebacteria bacterium GW2011_GWB1_38_8 TaxID=1618570 RepID=A0A0G0P6D0_9BACT|nr:MAG: hypothetical protein UT08_C0013G0018 [Candidatus Woesebacteria bacterium GW2011_GWB1_38_8]